jgi:hypothetical protein
MDYRRVKALVYAVRDETGKCDTKEQEYVIVDPGMDDTRLLVIESEVPPGTEPQRLGLVTGSRYGAAVCERTDLAGPTKSRQPQTRMYPSLVTPPQDELRRESTATKAANRFANRFLVALTRNMQ